MEKCERFRYTDRVYKSFIRNGAMLDEDGKRRLTEIDMELSTLSPKFSDNVLDATNAYELYLTDPKEVEGIPENRSQCRSISRQAKK